MSASFPIRGIAGVVTGGPGEPEAAERSLQAGGDSSPHAVEVRADLFSPPQAAIAWVARLAARAPVIFTVRLRSHAGQWDGDEAARTRLYREALEAGASLVDAEWDSPSARELARHSAPLVASHHDLQGMPGDSELSRITAGMLALRPRALKCVPRASSQRDGLRMLQWTAEAAPDGPVRLGFAMGEAGLPSRILSIAWGAPYTYGSLSRAVAPGQITAGELRGLYRAHALSRSTRVYGVVGNPIAHSLSPYLHNAAMARRGLDAVYIPYRAETFSELLSVAGPLGLEGLSVTIPFKEDAFRAAHEADARSQSSGASNTLLLGEHRKRLRAFNTDFDGVLEPLRRRGVRLEGLSAAIIGNGGAARGAARALLEAGAGVTIYFRNPERGAPVARELGVKGEPLAALERGRHRLIVNATPVGMHPGDPSPVDARVFEPGTLAFDMIYDPSETPFLVEARKAGAPTIPGREMLISQALVQFRLFTGQTAAHEEMDAAFLAGQQARSRLPLRP